MKITKIKVIKNVTFKKDILWVLFNCFLPTIKPVLTITSEQGPARSNDQPELSFKIFPSPFSGTGAGRIKFWSRISRGEVCSRKFVLNKILGNRELYNGIVSLSVICLFVSLFVCLSVRPSVRPFLSFSLSFSRLEFLLYLEMSPFLQFPKFKMRMGTYSSSQK